MERSDLMRRYGAMGDRLYHLSRGQDDRAVASRPGRQERVGRNHLRHRSRFAWPTWCRCCAALSEKVSARLKKSGIAGRTVVLKLKTQDFKTAHPQPPARRPDPAGRPHLPDRAAPARARKPTARSYRLLGIGVSDLTDDDKADPPDLVDVQSRKRALAEGAIDTLRDKFGRKAVETGYTFGKGRSAHPPEPIDE